MFNICYADLKSSSKFWKKSIHKLENEDWKTKKGFITKDLFDLPITERAKKTLSQMTIKGGPITKKYKNNPITEKSKENTITESTNKTLSLTTIKRTLSLRNLKDNQSLKNLKRTLSMTTLTRTLSIPTTRGPCNWEI